MSRGGWWWATTREARPRFWWFWHRQPRTEAPTRVALETTTPPMAESFRIAGPLPECVRALPGDSPIPDSASSIDLELMTEDTARSSRRSSPNGSSAGDRSDAGPTAKPEGSTLAERLRAVLAVPLDSLLPGPAATLNWPGELMPFQLDGVRALIASERILLADDMGLGKTIQAIAAIRILSVQRTIASVLIVVPAAIVRQWQREYRRWAPELRTIIVHGPAHDRAWQWNARVHVTIVSYDTLRADLTAGAMSAPGRRRWDLVVLDEAQRIKNSDTATSRLLKRLDRERSWALTGTPLENSLDDLVSIMEFVDHAAESTQTSRMPAKTLLRRHRELQLRRRKADVLEQLPLKQVIEIYIMLGPSQHAAYQRAEEEGIVQLREKGAAVRVQHVLELIIRLKQICNFDPQTGESAKMDNIRERLNALAYQGHRALLFSQYTDDTFGVDAAARTLEEYRPLTYTGSMSGADRDEIIATFKSNILHKLLILSVRAGGVGLNLQEASYVFHLDRWWNPAVERQAEDRSHRMGQVMPVTIFKYVCEGTIEERIRDILHEKQKLYDEVIDDVSFDLASRLTEHELFGLFGLEAPHARHSLDDENHGMT